MEVKKITRLIEKYADFELETGKNDYSSFAFWLLKKDEKKSTNKADLAQLHRDIGYYLNRVNKYSKYLSRFFLSELEVDSLDEFSFLTAIKILGSPAKSEVYELTITELTTGQQMMRRLVKKGLVEEFRDEEDQRKVRVRLSKNGKIQQLLGFEQIGNECNLKFGGLDNTSKQSLLSVLKELDQANAKNLELMRSQNS